MAISCPEGATNMALLNYTMAGVLGAMVALIIFDAQLNVSQKTPAMHPVEATSSPAKTA